MRALDASVSVQRQLVADTSHELRTPMASLRTNIEVLQQSPSLPQAERERVLADVVAQLEQLTALINDVIELARGRRAGAGARGGAPRRSRRRGDRSRRGGTLRTPTSRTTCGRRSCSATRRDSAARSSNLLDNALKFGPPERARSRSCCAMASWPCATTAPGIDRPTAARIRPLLPRRRSATGARQRARPCDRAPSRGRPRRGRYCRERAWWRHVDSLPRAADVWRVRRGRRGEGSYVLLAAASG